MALHIAMSLLKLDILDTKLQRMLPILKALRNMSHVLLALIVLWNKLLNAMLRTGKTLLQTQVTSIIPALLQNDPKTCYP
jgi:hypothetical protein